MDFFTFLATTFTLIELENVLPRLYIDWLAHWRCSLVDPQIEFEAFVGFPRPFSTMYHENHAIFHSFSAE